MSAGISPLMGNAEQRPAFLFAPVPAGEGHSGKVSDAPDHMLPYGIFFEEYAVRRAQELQQGAIAVFQLPPNSCEADVWNELRKRLRVLDSTYQQLAKCKLNPDTPPSEIDRLEAECQGEDQPLKLLLHKMEGSAVCLSGGGIRSASFCLGVLEGLARFSTGVLCSGQTTLPSEEPSGLLHRLDYLSTVSGGGYIGSWLSAWIYRRWHAAVKPQLDGLKLAYEQEDQTRTRGAQPAIDAARQNVEEAKRALHWNKRAALKRCYQAVIQALAGESATTSGDPWPQPIRHLREYTSYLAPALGLSLDSWTLAAIVFRNLFINWLMLLPLLLAAVALPQVAYFFSRDVARALAQSSGWTLFAIVLVGVCFLIAAVVAAYSLPSHRGPHDAGPPLARVFWSFATPVMLANWLLAELWWSVSAEGASRLELRFVLITLFVLAEAGIFCLGLGVYRSYFRRLRWSTHKSLIEGFSNFLRKAGIFVAGLASALVSIALAGLFYEVVLPATATQPVDFASDQRLLVTFGLPLITLIPFLTTSLLSGLLGIFEAEEDREWWSRAGAIQLAIVVVWIVGLTIALYGGALYKESLHPILSFGASGGLLGGLASALGFSGNTSAGPRPVKSAQLGKVGSFLEKHDLLLPTLCALAVLLLAIGAANAEELLAGALAPSPDAAGLAAHLWVFVLAALLAIVINWAISINLFSLNGLYRMRLMRAFLGASNSQRSADPFTGFDPRDTPWEIDLPEAPGAPLHVINTTLNLVNTQDTAWRQRKAEPFSFSPLHSGSWRVGYVPTRYYAGADGPTLATAMTISGAAFNPNMGYHSSPLVTLIMTFFNVRLGWWLPNPKREEGVHLFKTTWPPKGEDFLRRTGPSFGLEPLLMEAFGLTNDTYRWIELTDGGHFENLALYEMVMRRCKNIIVLDAGADPTCQFEDLGNALRKIEIDLGIPIRFHGDLPFRAGAKRTNHYCAVADIDYACADGRNLGGPEREALKGKLVYIKAAINGSEPPDIKQYALTHKDFPHESTANQFFNESQFESYRHLGSYAVEQIVAPAGAVGNDFAAFIEAAIAYSRA